MPRPSIPLISRHLAVETTLQIIDAGGYEEFSLEKLARQLNVKSPSLYHHFANKSDLLRATAFHLLRGIEVAEPDPRAWQDWFVDLCIQLHRRILEHPRAAGLLFRYFPEDLTVGVHERGMALLAQQGFPVAMRWGIMRGIEKMVFGLAFADADDAVSGRNYLAAVDSRADLPNLVVGLEADELSGEQLVAAAVRAYLTGAQLLYATPSRRKRKAV